MNRRPPCAMQTIKRNKKKDGEERIRSRNLLLRRNKNIRRGKEEGRIMLESKCTKKRTSCYFPS